MSLRQPKEVFCFFFSKKKCFLLATSEKFIAEQRKLIAEAEKLSAEQRKLYSESAKLDRDRWLAPWLVLVAIIGGIVGAIGGIITMLGAIAHLKG